jgi:hypothetical protein
MTTERIPLTPPQKDMFMMERMRPGSTNITMRVLTPSSALADIERAGRGIVMRHDVLRLQVIRATSEMTVADGCEPEVVVARDPKEVAEHANRPIAMEATTPNVRMILDESPGRDRCVRVVVPHAFTDGRSSGLLHAELHRSLRDSPSGTDEPVAGFSEFARRIHAAYEAPDDAVVGFWEEHLRDAEALPKEHVSQPRDPGYVDIPLGTPDGLARIQRQVKATEFVVLLSLFAHGVQQAFEMPSVPCRTVFLGRRSRETMGVVGPFAELPLLRLDVTGGPVDRGLQAAVVHLFKATQPRRPLVERFTQRAREATRRACFFRDNRNLFVGENRTDFLAENHHLLEDDLPARASAGRDLEFVPADDVALFGVEHPWRGEVIHRADDGRSYLRLLTAQVDRRRVLRAAAAIQHRFAELDADAAAADDDDDEHARPSAAGLSR